ncbi:hemolysin family protein [Halopiger thermotolerans]
MRVATVAAALVGIDPPRGLVTAVGVATLGALLLLSGFFSSSETAMFSLAQHRIEALVEDGAPGAETVRELQSDPHRLLVTILVGNNLVNVAMSSIATGLLGMYLAQGRAVLAATFGVTAVVLLFGESAPKSYAVENTESWALTVARPLRLSAYALYPLVVTFDRLTRLINGVVGGTAVESSYVTRDELRELIRTGESEGVIDRDEREMLQRVFRFGDTIAKEVMTPRLDVTAVPRSATVDEAVAKCLESGHARLPVYEGDLDTVVGVVELGDLVRGARDRDGDPSGDSLEAYLEETLQVPESKQVDDLFRELRRRRVEQAIVVDEFGTTEGIVTTEDIVETVVGEILDAQEDDPIEILDEGTARVDGEVTIEAVNDAIGVDLPEGEEFETIAGFVFNRAGRLVDAGETFAYDGVALTVEAVDDARITRVRVTKSIESPPAEAGIAASD